MTRPLVSIVTPTFPGREQPLKERCIPSVRALSWGGPIEHVIVSDENPALREWARPFHDFHVDGLERSIRFVEINDTWKNDATRFANGAVPWMVGSRLALGEFMNFLGDDDELFPHHVMAHVDAMVEHSAMWSVSRIEFRAGGNFWAHIGDDSFTEGHLDATGIMCHKSALTVATWDPAAGIPAVDWKLVNDWRTAGVPGVFVDDVTGVHHDGWLTGMTGKPYHE